MEHDETPAPASREPRTATLISGLVRRSSRAAVIVAVAALVGMAVPLVQPERHVAAVEVVVADPRSSLGVEVLQLSRDPIRFGRAEASYLESREVAERAAEIGEGGHSASEIDAAVTARSLRELDLIVVEAEADSSDAAQAMAQAAVDAYAELRREAYTAKADTAVSALDAELAELDAEGADEAEIALVRDRVAQIRADQLLYGSGVREAREPQLRSNDASLRAVARSGAVSGFVALVVVLAVIWWREETNPVVGDRHAAAGFLDAPLLGVVHGNERRGITSTPESLEPAVVALTRRLQHDGGARVAVGGHDGGQAAATVGLHLAAAAAGLGHAPLVVDTNLRGGGQTIVGATAGGGLVGFATSPGASANDYVANWEPPAAGERVDVLAGGDSPEHIGRFFRDERFAKAMAELRDHGDLTVVLTPPLVGSPEVLDILAHTDGVVVVVAADTPLAALVETRRTLAVGEMPITGYVFVARPRRRWRR